MARTTKETTEPQGIEAEEAAPNPIRIAQIKIDGDTQARESIDEATVAEYADAMASGVEFPPITVVYDGRHFWLVDGFHRYHAATKAGVKSLQSVTVRGTRETARWLACGANQTHGLRRTNADKRRAVSIALSLKPELSDRAIAEHCGVDHKTVAAVRAESTGEIPQLTPRVGRDGRARPSRRIGSEVDRKQAADEIPEDPYLARVESAKAALSAIVAQIDAALRAVRATAETDDGAYLHLQAIDSDLQNARAGIKSAMPAGRCARCGGAGCSGCRNVGWISRLQASTDPKGCVRDE